MKAQTERNILRISIDMSVSHLVRTEAHSFKCLCDFILGLDVVILI